jgi:heme-degrading monooxygenase HmoA
MHAVIIEVDTSGADRDTAVQRVTEEIVPRVKSLPGFQSGTWLRPAEGSQKGLSLMVFDTEEHAAAAHARLGVGDSPQPGVTIERSELREVLTTA